jgi:hypothetical protein
VRQDGGGLLGGGAMLQRLELFERRLPQDLVLRGLRARSGQV